MFGLTSTALITAFLAVYAISYFKTASEIEVLHLVRYKRMPSLSILFDANKSLECIFPQLGQAHSLSESFNSLFITPQVQVFDEAYHLSTF